MTERDGAEYDGADHDGAHHHATGDSHPGTAGHEGGTGAMHATTSGYDALQAPAVPNTDVITTDEPAPPARRRGPDPLALVVGLATLVMAVFAFVGELPDLPGFDPRWLLAGGAVVIGLMLLVGSLRNRSGGRRGGG